MMNEKQKYIVEVTVPENGQELSSGGVRENGKMVEMYSNPVPYYESEKKPVSSASRAVSVARTENRYTAKTSPQNRTETVLKEFVHDFCLDMANGIWVRVKPRLIAYVSDKFYSYITEKVDRRQNATTSAQPKSKRFTTKAEELLKQLENVSDAPKVVMPNNIILFPCGQVS